MKKVQIVYWSGTGNTENMANILAQGVKEGGAEYEVISADSADANALLENNVFALGCPSMGSEELEDSVMEPFVSAIESGISGKQIVLFGSYGWGDGEWMRNWVERMEKAGASVIDNEGIIANGEPDSAVEVQLKEAGKKLAKLSM